MADTSRRAPLPEARRHDADRSRALLLDAARAEFASKGRAGARVSEIARRAGVNKQLISYYFGGKEGLYQAILQQWQEQEAEITEPGISLDELAFRYLEAGLHNPDQQRLFLRESFEQDPAESSFEPDAPELLDLRDRQTAGEIAPELDPAFVLLVLQSFVVSGAVFPGDTKRLTGLDPQSPEYLDRMGRQLRLLARRLA